MVNFKNKRKYVLNCQLHLVAPIEGLGLGNESVVLNVDGFEVEDDEDGKLALKGSMLEFNNMNHRL
jgi:hypothetical protein